MTEADTDTDAPEPAPEPAGTAAPTPAPARKRGSGRAGLWVSATALALLATAGGIGAGLGWQALAVQASAEAHQHLEAESKALGDVTDRRGMALDKAHASLDSIEDFAAQTRPDYLTEATAAALTKAQSDLKAKSENLRQVTFDPPQVPVRSADLLPWTVLTDVQHKAALTRSEENTRKTRAAELKALDKAQQGFGTSVAAVYTEIAAHGEQVLTADTSATYASKIVLRHAIDDGKADGSATGVRGSALQQIVAAIGGVDTAQAAGEAAKRDPAYPVRAQVEAYARSIAHGVTLDFEWHKEVSGLGDGWYSGTTQYNEGDGGWATIDLNFTIQDGWSDGDRDAKALVTHEVGHSQVVRPECKTLFDGPVFNRDDEMWATAWAIAMGFDTGGSGIEAYGRPSDQQIAVAGQCR